MSRRLRAASAGLLLVASGLGLPGVGWAGEPAPTHGVVARELVRRLARRLDAGLARQDIDGPLLLRAVGTQRAGEAVLTELGELLASRGVQWTLQTSPAESAGTALRLEVDVEKLSLAYPRIRRPFLVLGSRQVERRLDIRLSARLLASAESPPLWQAAPEVSYRDWVSERTLANLEEDGPTWLPPRPTVGAGDAGGPAWLERAGALALLGSVILFYAAGAN